MFGSCSERYNESSTYHLNIKLTTTQSIELDEYHELHICLLMIPVSFTPYNSYCVFAQRQLFPLHNLSCSLLWVILLVIDESLCTSWHPESYSHSLTSKVRFGTLSLNFTYHLSKFSVRIGTLRVVKCILMNFKIGLLCNHCNLYETRFFQTCLNFQNFLCHVVI